MKELAEKLGSIVKQTRPQLMDMNPLEWDYKSAPTKWSKKQILGHLVDSAANNHQRFVRVQFEENPVILYNPDNWVNAQKYEDADTENLIDLWASYNNHLAFIISKMKKSKYQNLCDIKKENPVTLEWLAHDYVRHLEHHLKQLVSHFK